MLMIRVWVGPIGMMIRVWVVSIGLMITPSPCRSGPVSYGPSGLHHGGLSARTAQAGRGTGVPGAARDPSPPGQLYTIGTVSAIGQSNRLYWSRTYKAFVYGQSCSSWSRYWGTWCSQRSRSTRSVVITTYNRLTVRVIGQSNSLFWSEP